MKESVFWNRRWTLDLEMWIASEIAAVPITRQYEEEATAYDRDIQINPMTWGRECRARSIDLFWTRGRGAFVPDCQ